MQEIIAVLNATHVLEKRKLRFIFVRFFWLLRHLSYTYERQHRAFCFDVTFSRSRKGVHYFSLFSNLLTCNQLHQYFVYFSVTCGIIWKERPSARGTLLRILDRGVTPCSLNPDPISDQNMPFSTTVFRPGLGCNCKAFVLEFGFTFYCLVCVCEIISFVDR